MALVSREVTIGTLTKSLLLLLFSTASFAGIKGTKHDLRDVISRPSSELCVFCHTPHNANTQIAPLWNRRITRYDVYTMYQSPTLNAPIRSTPNKISLACLSCHDISAAYGSVGAVYGGDQHSLINFYDTTTTAVNCTRCHYGSPFYSPLLNIGPNLSNDHPISIAYPNSGQDPDFKTPPDLKNGWSDVKLFEGYVECASCHNPHDNSRGKFLRRSNGTSNLCYTCHSK